MLVTVRHPLNDDSHRIIQCGREYLTDESDSLIVLHVALLQHSDKLCREELRAAAELAESLGTRLEIVA